LANEHDELKQHFAVPLNSFDQFETPAQARAKLDAEQRLEAMNALDRLIRERDVIIQQKDEIILQSRIWKWTYPKWLARLLPKSGRR
jgi:hypothetical protein